MAWVETVIERLEQEISALQREIGELRERVADLEADRSNRVQEKRPEPQQHGHSEDAVPRGRREAGKPEAPPVSRPQ